MLKKKVDVITAEELARFPTKQLTLTPEQAAKLHGPMTPEREKSLKEFEELIEADNVIRRKSRQ